MVRLLLPLTPLRTWCLLLAATGAGLLVAAGMAQGVPRAALFGLASAAKAALIVAGFIRLPSSHRLLGLALIAYACLFVILATVRIASAGWLTAPFPS